MLESACESCATADVGVGRDQQAVKMELLLKSSRPSKRKMRKQRRRLNPENENVYAMAVNTNTVLLKAEDIWRDVSLQEKCVAVEKVLLETAEHCREFKRKAACELCESWDYFACADKVDGLVSASERKSRAARSCRS